MVEDANHELPTPPLPPLRGQPQGREAAPRPRIVWSFGGLQSADMVGQLLSDRFQIQEQLGEGGMGQVYLATDVTLGRQVAIKFMRVSDWSDALAKRFAREGEILASLNHPAILPVHGGGVIEGRGPFLVLPLVEGAQDLKTYAAGRPLAERVACFTAVAQALAYLHAQGVLHRDVKPDNVLVDADGRVYLTDFGLAWAPGVDDLTVSRAFLGTPFYAPPEVLTGQAQRTAQGDVYSLGMVLYELLTGQHPFADVPTLVELLARSSKAPPPPPSALEPQVSRRLDAVCLRALDPDPRQRFPDAGALLAALESPSEGRLASRRALLAAAGLSVVAVLAGAIAWGPGAAGDTSPPHPAPAVAAPPSPPEEAAPVGLLVAPKRGQRLRVALSSGTGLRRGGSPRDVGNWSVELALECTRADDDALAFEGRIVAFKTDRRFVKARLAYDSEHADPEAATFFSCLIGAPITLTRDPRTWAVRRVTGLDRVRDEEMRLAAKAWRDSRRASKALDFLVMSNDETLLKGLAEYSDEAFAGDFSMLTAFAPPPDPSVPWTVAAQTKPALVWSPLPVTFTLRERREGLYELTGTHNGPRANLHTYSADGSLRFADGLLAEATITERYTMDFEPATAQSLVLDNFGVSDWASNKIPLTRTLRYSARWDE